MQKRTRIILSLVIVMALLAGSGLPFGVPPAAAAEEKELDFPIRCGGNSTAGVSAPKREAKLPYFLERGSGDAIVTLDRKGTME